jgi:hypothetical protein
MECRRNLIVDEYGRFCGEKFMKSFCRDDKRKKKNVKYVVV